MFSKILRAPWRTLFNSSLFSSYIRILAHKPNHLRFTAVIGHIPAALAMGVFIGYVIHFYTFSDVFEFDPDEGNNLIKALLIERGFSIGAEIWSDQPPGFTYILFGVFKIFGWRVEIARLTVLVFAGIIMFVVYEMLRKSLPAYSGHVAAVAGCLALFLSQLFTQLSVSVMIGLPAISTMVVSLFAIHRFTQSWQSRWLFIAGALMGLAFAIKMFIAFLVPVYLLFVATIALRRHLKIAQLGWRRAVARSAIDSTWMLLGFGGVALICLLPLLIHGTLENLFEPHRVVRMAKDGSSDGFATLRAFVRHDRWLFVLALLGAYRALMTRHIHMMLWVCWLFSACLFLYDHSPVWTHHRLLITIPGAVLAGFAIGALIPAAEKGAHGLMVACTGCLWMGLIAIVIVLSFLHMEDSLRHGTVFSKNKKEAKIQQVINDYRSDINYMVTARQMYAFRARRPIPPNLAITSAKRFQADLISGGDIVKEIDVYHPELVVLSSRWSKKVRKIVRRNLKHSYERVYRNRRYYETEIWVRKILVTAH